MLVFLGNILWGGSAGGLDDGDDEEEDDEEEEDDDAEDDEGYVLVAMLVALFRIVTVLLRAQKVKPSTKVLALSAPGILCCYYLLFRDCKPL